MRSFTRHGTRTDGSGECRRRSADRRLRARILHEDSPLSEKCRALVAEDDIAIARLMSRVLQREGFDVDQTQSGSDALQRIESARYHLVIL